MGSFAFVGIFPFGGLTVASQVLQKGLRDESAVLSGRDRGPRHLGPPVFLTLEQVPLLGLVLLARLFEFLFFFLLQKKLGIVCIFMYIFLHINIKYHILHYNKYITLY